MIKYFSKHKNVSANYRFTSLRPYVHAPLCPYALMSPRPCVLTTLCPRALMSAPLCPEPFCLRPCVVDRVLRLACNEFAGPYLRVITPEQHGSFRKNVAAVATLCTI